ncbi:helix-turn-helix domain-containing protein [Peptacetobacter sp. AB800]|uniref:helix-turn-helix domain-containing protein n=1 Tax=Peptacetobacter sp. AB800 TaxID=3388428 RepID=UPI0039FD0F75
MNNINSKNFSKELSNRIKRRREELGLSYSYIAEKTGLSRSTLLRYENGMIKNIPADKIETLAKVLKINPVQMMGWDMNLETNELNENEKILISMFRELNIKGKNKVKEYVKDMTKINEYTMSIQITTAVSNTVCSISTNPNSLLTRRANNDKQYDDKEQELMNEDFEMMKKWKEENNK